MGEHVPFTRRQFTIRGLLLGGLGFVRELVGPHAASAASPPIQRQGPGQMRQPSGQMQQSPSGTTAPFRADWPVWLAAAKKGTRAAVTQWASQARLTGVQVNGPTATGGHLSGPDIGGLISNAMREAGMPDNAAWRFGQGVNAAWKAWADTVRAPGARWYPAFAAVPGPVAPPTPNVPCPLAALAQDIGKMSPGAIAGQIKGALGSAREWPGASAIDDWASGLSAAFMHWTTSCTVRSVMGTGPVPTFAPPYVPVGPVVNGKANQDAGGMGCPFQWR